LEGFRYVYIIDSQSFCEHYYIGYTSDLSDRLAHHNAGAVPSTKQFRPWAYRTCIAFSEEHKARKFERYLKSHSGRAFISRHL
jgi:putative endonuclease